MAECSFCRILAGDLPASVVFEDDLVYALLDIQPINPGHTLVIPKIHAGSLADLPVDTLTRMMAVAQRIAQGFESAGIACEGVNLFLADGEAAGQEVPHTHLHVIPRISGDGFGLRFGPGYGPRPSRDVLDGLAVALRDAICRS